MSQPMVTLDEGAAALGVSAAQVRQAAGRLRVKLVDVRGKSSMQRADLARIREYIEAVAENQAAPVVNPETGESEVPQLVFPVQTWQQQENGDGHSAAPAPADWANGAAGTDAEPAGHPAAADADSAGDIRPLSGELAAEFSGDAIAAFPADGGPEPVPPPQENGAQSGEYQGEVLPASGDYSGFVDYPDSGNHKDDDTDSVEGQTMAAPSGDAAPAAEAAETAARRVLLVEPDDALAGAEAEALATVGFGAEVAAGRAGMLMALKQGSFDLVLIDHGVEDGLRMLAELQRVRPGQAAALMIADPETAESVRADGTACILKDQGFPQSLGGEVESMLNGARTRQAEAAPADLVELEPLPEPAEMTELPEIVPEPSHDGRQWTDAFDHSPVGLFRLNADGIVTRANPRLAELAGYGEPSALNGASLRDQLSVDSAECNRLLQAAAAPGGAAGKPLSLRGADGRPVPLSIHLRATTDASGRIIAYEGAVTPAAALPAVPVSPVGPAVPPAPAAPPAEWMAALDNLQKQFEQLRSGLDQSLSALAGLRSRLTAAPAAPVAAAAVAPAAAAPVVVPVSAPATRPAPAAPVAAAVPAAAAPVAAAPATAAPVAAPPPVVAAAPAAPPVKAAPAAPTPPAAPAAPAAAKAPVSVKATVAPARRPGSSSNVPALKRSSGSGNRPAVAKPASAAARPSSAAQRPASGSEKPSSGIDSAETEETSSGPVPVTKPKEAKPAAERPAAEPAPSKKAAAVSPVPPAAVPAQIISAPAGGVQMTSSGPVPNFGGGQVQMSSSGFFDMAGVTSPGDSRSPNRGDAEVLDLNALTRQAVWFAEPKIKANGRPVEISQKLGFCAPIRGNRARLREVIARLVLNAADLMPGGGKISISSGTIPKGVFVAVSNTGAGIPAEIKRRLFDEDFVPTEDWQHVLRECLEIMLKHSGKIGLISEPGKGCTVTIRVPAAIIDDEPTVEVR